MVRKTKSTNAHWNFLIAAGILAHTPDSMVLSGQAVPRLQYALHLVKAEDTFEDFCDLLKSRLSHFDELHPEFPVEEFVDRVFDENATITPEEGEDIQSVARKCSEEWNGAVRKLYRSTAFMDKARSTASDLYDELLNLAASDPQFVHQSLKRV
jgi:hypothetical protein